MLSKKRKLGYGLAVVGAGVTKTKSMCHLRTHNKHVVRRAQLTDLV